MNTFEIVAIIILIVLATILVSLFAFYQNNKKLRKKIQEQFGAPPEQDDPEFSSISAPWKIIDEKLVNAPLIDRLTWNDLDMNDVYTRMNVCQTSIGEEFLYSTLHQPQSEQKVLQKRESCMQNLKQHPELRIKIQIYLAILGKLNNNGLYAFMNEAEVKMLRFTNLYRILSYLPLALLAVIPFNYKIGIVGLFAAVLLNIVTYFIVERGIQQETTTIQYFSSMLWCCNQICKIKDEGFKQTQSELQENYRYFKSMRGRVPSMMKRNAMVSDIDFVMEYFRILTLYDIKSYNKIVRSMIDHKENCTNIYNLIGELDMLISVLSFRESLPFYTQPHFVKSMQMNVQEIYHPLLRNPVPNTITISNDCIITGSNASGKSTFIKALAINGILGQTINTCTAKVFQMPFALIVTSMAVRDNISEGDSYFVAELKSLKRLLDMIECRPCICFVDEILKGTNTIERIAASASVLRYFNNHDCLCVVASHDIELSEILKDIYNNYNFCEQINDDGITFDYTIKEGASQTRNAIKLLHFMNFEPEIVKNANEMADQFIQTQKW